MKRIFVLFCLIAMLSSSVMAQTSESAWSVNTRFWTTNYWTAILAGTVEEVVQNFAFKNNEKDSLWAERILPDVALTLPVGLQKDGLSGANAIFNPYHRAWGNPLLHTGDYGIGADVAYKPSNIGVYAGAYYKSQEVIFRATRHNLRGYYFQPRAGVIYGFEKFELEAGVFYDFVTGCGGNNYLNKTTSRLDDGWGLDFSVGLKGTPHSKSIIQFSMPLHNFFNSSYPDQLGMKRKVGYVMFTRRISL